MFWPAVLGISFVYLSTGLAIWLACIDPKTGGAPRIWLALAWPIFFIFGPDTRAGDWLRDRL